eukprot:858450-Pelagomonas_calceolata.AAC.3
MAALEQETRMPQLYKLDQAAREEVKCALKAYKTLGACTPEGGTEFELTLRSKTGVKNEFSSSVCTLSLKFIPGWLLTEQAPPKMNFPSLIVWHGESNLRKKPEWKGALHAIYDFAWGGQLLQKAKMQICINAIGCVRARS